MSKRCPHCGRVQPDPVLTCDCGYNFPKRTSTLPAVLRFPHNLIFILGCIGSIIGSIFLESAGVFLLFLGVWMIFVGKERIWDFEKWRLQLGGVEGNRTDRWEYLFYLGIIVLICWGAVQLWIDIVTRR